MVGGGGGEGPLTEEMSCKRFLVASFQALELRTFVKQKTCSGQRACAQKCIFSNSEPFPLLCLHVP